MLKSTVCTGGEILNSLPSALITRKKKTRFGKALKDLHAANTNYLFNSDDKYKLIEAVDPKWDGALPYTVLVEPGGKIVYGKQGTIDPMEMKTTIVENKLIGRFY